MVKRSALKRVKENKDGSFAVRSDSNPEECYLVRKAAFGKHWVCNCPAFIFRKLDTGCKHIAMIKVYLEGKKDRT